MDFFWERCLGWVIGKTHALETISLIIALGWLCKFADAHNLSNQLSLLSVLFPYLLQESQH
jgi:hypothetical protein